MLYNVYCDETCHLENDGINDMVLGAVYCQKSKLRKINQRIIQIKEKYNVSSNVELKWIKISPAKIDLYKELINDFFDNSDIYFRAIIIPDKGKLNHETYNQTHDDWYYKMYFNMLKVIFSPYDEYEVYIDIKDTNTYQKAKKLNEVCCNQMYDFSHRVIKKIQPVRSDEIQIMQLVDILIGAVGYENRRFPDEHVKSKAKLELIQLIKERSNYTLTRTTLFKEEKFNLFVWKAGDIC